MIPAAVTTMRLARSEATVAPIYKPMQAVYPRWLQVFIFICFKVMIVSVTIVKLALNFLPKTLII